MKPWEYINRIINGGATNEQASEDAQAWYEEASAKIRADALREQQKKELMKMAFPIPPATPLPQGLLSGAQGYTGNQAGGLGVRGIAGTQFEPSCQCATYIDPQSKLRDPMRLLMGRLRKDDLPASKFQFMVIAVMPTKTIVTLYKDDEMTSLEDTTSLFPSDKLVTQMRLLLG